MTAELPHEFAVLVARCERSTAERDYALMLLAELVAMHDSKSMSTPQQQATLRTAKALIAELGR